MKTKTIKVNVPGLRNSDENHWQSYFETQNAKEFIRIEQQNWEEPNGEAWINQIEKQLKPYNKSELILIGHSIGCIAIVNWISKFNHAIKGALLVAPSDAEQPNYPKYISGFKPIYSQKLPFKSIVIGSTNDHVSQLVRVQAFANNWGSKMVVLKNAGHIETKSGYGKWPKGLELLSELESIED